MGGNGPVLNYFATEGTEGTESKCPCGVFHNEISSIFRANRASQF